jgi:mannosyltransferase
MLIASSTAGKQRGDVVGPSSALAVIIPNLHWRYSGVTATNRAVAPRLAARIGTAWLGPDAPQGMPKLGLADLLALRRGAERGRARIWHARRNNEMMVGLALKFLGWPLKLVFTSAGQRHHTWITRAMIACMDAVIATSEASAAYLRCPATVVLHGVDANRYRPASDRAAAFAAAGLPGKYAVGCFGRVRAQKGTDLFVEAMCRLLPKYPDFSAVVIGPVTPEQRGFAARLTARVEEAGLGARVKFLGELPVDEVPLWYQRILIYAFTSRVEGFGLTLLEAMAAGTALVAARAGGAEYVVGEGSGVLISPDDIDALVQALEPLLRDPAKAEAMGAKARARVLSEFSVDAEAERIAAVYRRVLEK